ncbi:hypothetical protein OsI_15098 [Oryza sativa Indica Group]|uniref:OSJNBb0018J12.2 protein n=2 Tax=Oryza sativa TaxID=4530 RepID=Q7X7L5_ORYSJ|nr:hypothetical protein OsI_15098 [Oryza sativa Indica Group]EAZ29982.1 hypothetical protein OsJ_14041 [Oryza sativa Japonica Group]CAE04789.1 OSJNBb0018J12.2 [Oryza sativa Japonica Group]
MEVGQGQEQINCKHAKDNTSAFKVHGNKKTTKEQCTKTATPIPRSLVYERDAQGTK